MVRDESNADDLQAMNFHFIIEPHFDGTT